MKLLGKRVVFREQAEAEVKKTTIITLNEEEKHPFIKGEVVAVGHEVKDDLLGKVILVNRFQSGMVKWGKEELQMVEASEVIAVQDD